MKIDLGEKAGTIAAGLGIAFLVFGIICAISLIVGMPVKWLWNATLPDLLGVKPISFWQSVGLFILCQILFRSSVNSSK